MSIADQLRDVINRMQESDRRMQELLDSSLQRQRAILSSMNNELSCHELASEMAADLQEFE